MIGLDSNVVVRFLAQDDPGQSAAANRLIETELTALQPGYISLPALAEIVWVMVSCYAASRELVREVVERLLSAPQLRVQCAEQVWQALHAFAGGKADFSDALIGALATHAGCRRTVTFDQVASREPGFELLEGKALT